MTKIATALLLCLTACSSYHDPMPAAQAFAKHIPGSSGVTCMDQDTDGDGYCSCTVFRSGLENNAQARDPVGISCGCGRNSETMRMAEGCKMAALGVTR